MDSSASQTLNKKKDELLKYQELRLLGNFIETDDEHAYKNINELWNSVLEPKKPLGEDSDEEEKKVSDKENIVNKLEKLDLGEEQKGAEKK